MLREVSEKRKTTTGGMSDIPWDWFTFEQKDRLRRVLLEQPPEISSEGEMLAYCRGFLSGAQRSAEESKRFAALKDLVHRIAAEMARRLYRLRFEDAVSYGYEAALRFLRNGKIPEDHIHFRKRAAVAIRNGIKDCLRGTPTVPVIGPARALTRRGCTGKALYGHQFAVSPKGESADLEVPARTSERTEVDPDRLNRVVGLKPLDRLILELYSAGYTCLEIGNRVGLTESRISQRMTNMRKRHGRKLDAALSTD